MLNHLFASKQNYSPEHQFEEPQRNFEYQLGSIVVENPGYMTQVFGVGFIQKPTLNIRYAVDKPAPIHFSASPQVFNSVISPVATNKFQSLEDSNAGEENSSYDSPLFAEATQSPKEQGNNLRLYKKHQTQSATIPDFKKLEFTIPTEKSSEFSKENQIKSRPENQNPCQLVEVMTACDSLEQPSTNIIDELVKLERTKTRAKKPQPRQVARSVKTLSSKKQASAPEKKVKQVAENISKLSSKSKKIQKDTPPVAHDTVCPYCPKTFAKPQGLGGHVSKAHPGMSLTYAEKMETRKKRAPARQLLQKAKDLLKEKDGKFNFKENRSVLNSLKTLLIKGGDTDEFLLKLKH